MLKNLKSHFWQLIEKEASAKTEKSESQNNDSDNSQAQSGAGLGLPNHQRLQQEVQDFLVKMRKGPSFASWILAFFFLVIPIIGTIMALFMKLDQWEVGENLSGIERLITGGTNRLLTFDAGQWWRFASYGLAVPGSGVEFSVVILIFAGISFFRLIKYAETFFGGFKVFGIFLLAYLFTGFFMSVTCPEVITGGLLPILAITLGLVAGGLGVQGGIVPAYMRSKYIWPIVWLLVIPFFNMDMIGDYIAIIVGLTSGMVIASLFNMKHHTKWGLRFNVLMLSALVIIAIVFAALTPSYAPAPNQTIATALSIYQKHGWIPNLSHLLDNLGWKAGQAVVIIR